jgi:hypothetical protein
MRSALIACLALLTLTACQSIDAPSTSTALHPVTVSRVYAVAQQGIVRLAWAVSGDDGRQFELLRQNRLEPWKHFATLTVVDGQITYEDAGVVPGQSYRYRLKILGLPRDQFLDEVEVEVPR